MAYGGTRHPRHKRLLGCFVVVVHRGLYYLGRINVNRAEGKKAAQRHSRINDGKEGNGRGRTNPSPASATSSASDQPDRYSDRRRASVSNQLVSPYLWRPTPPTFLEVKPSHPVRTSDYSQSPLKTVRRLLPGSTVPNLAKLRAVDHLGAPFAVLRGQINRRCAVHPGASGT